jgi:uncharacterized membrane protein YbhN (UPF0104 family)
MQLLRSKASHLLRIAGLGLLIWAVTRVDLPETLAILRRADPWLAVLGISMAIPNVSVRSWRLRRILSTFGVGISLPHAFLIRMVGMAAGDVLPGRTGEVVTIAYLQKAGYGLKDPTLALILDRLFDFVILAGWAVAGFSIIGQRVGDEIKPLQGILVLSALAFTLAIAFLLFVRSRPGLINPLVHRFVPGTLQGFWRRSAARSEAVPPSRFGWNLTILIEMAAISAISFLFLIWRGFYLAKSIGIDLSLPFLTSCMAITMLLQLIPVSNVLGIGTREISLVYLFGLAGISGEQAIGFSVLIVLALLAQDILGLFLWWKYPVGIRMSPGREALPLKRDV